MCSDRFLSFHFFSFRNDSVCLWEIEHLREWLFLVLFEMSVEGSQSNTCLDLPTGDGIGAHAMFGRYTCLDYRFTDPWRDCVSRGYQTFLGVCVCVCFAACCVLCVVSCGLCVVCSVVCGVWGLGCGLWGIFACVFACLHVCVCLCLSRQDVLRVLLVLTHL